MRAGSSIVTREKLYFSNKVQFLDSLRYIVVVDVLLL